MGKKTVLVVSILLLLAVVSWFMFGNNMRSFIPGMNTPEASDSNIRIGSSNGASCIEFDSNGVCQAFVQVSANATKTVVVS